MITVSPAQYGLQPRLDASLTGGFYSERVHCLEMPSPVIGVLELVQ
jgi:hypothetical protein